MKVRLLFGVFVVLGICGCGLKWQKPAIEKSEKPTDGPQLVGRIASLPPDKRFALIQSYGKWLVETGRILTTRGPGDRTANLLVTGESLGEFAAADVQSGQVKVGDGVYSQHVVKPSSPEPSQAQQEAPSVNFLKNN